VRATRNQRIEASNDIDVGAVSDRTEAAGVHLGVPT
jgi:hypothetical protein